MATMLNGAAVMDAALLLIAANESCPQPQTSEHLAAIEIMKLKHILVLQNKVDLIREQQADEHHQQILQFVKGTVADGAPIVPISAQLRYNIDALVEFIVNKIPVPVRDFATAPKLIVIRSFDVNKPGAEVHELKGGVAGGSLLKGVLKVRPPPASLSPSSSPRLTLKTLTHPLVLARSSARRSRSVRVSSRRTPRARSTASRSGARSSRSSPRRTSSSLPSRVASLVSARVSRRSLHFWSSRWRRSERSGERADRAQQGKGAYEPELAHPRELDLARPTLMLGRDELSLERAAGSGKVANGRRAAERDELGQPGVHDVPPASQPCLTHSRVHDETRWRSVRGRSQQHRRLERRH